MIIVGIGSAIWLGILTSISPCPLATNIAAISFIGKNVGKGRHVILSGLFYTIGRSVTYIAVSMIVISGILSIPGVSSFLQEYINKIMGPVLVIVGMFLIELLRLNISGPAAGEKITARAASGGYIGALFLGVLFAVAFCPVSAALFFGALIPLAIRYESRVLLPLLYGLGTALPVLVFAVIIAYSMQSVGKAFNNLKKIEWWARRITGVVFILAGIYMSLKYIFEAPLIF